MGTTAEKLQKIINTKKALQTSINNKGGAITDNTPFDQYPLAVDNLSTPIYWDGIYIEEELVSGPTLTLLIGTDAPLNNKFATYSLDSGSTWNQFTSERIVLDNAEKIRFYCNFGSSFLCVGTSNGAHDIAYLIMGNESEDIEITEDTTWYVSHESD